jgi:ABC-type Fe3+-hydroxamate transport system substrate-binding protein
MVFTDQMGRRVVLKDFPQRIISLVPSQTELLHYLTGGKNIVGITRFCIHPRDFFIQTVKVGGTKDFDFARIDALKPDLIIGNKEENYREGIEKLAEKYPVWMSDVYNLADALQMIKEIGKLVNQSQKARLLAEQISHQFFLLNDMSKQWKSYTAAYFIWKKPLMVAGGDNFINDMLAKSGFENVFAGKGRYPEISEDELMKAAPELIFLSSEPYPFKERHLAYFNEICPDARVIIVDGEMFSWYGNRLALSADYFIKLRKNLSKSESKGNLKVIV